MELFSRFSSRRSFIAALAGTAALGVTHVAARNKPSAWLAPDAPTPDKKFVPVMLTPFTETLAVDFEALSRLIDFYEAAGAKGFFANCASSEMYELTPEERLAVVRHVVRRVNGRYPVVATGSFGDTMEERAAFTRRMHDTGVDAVILITSHFAARDESDDVLMRNLDRYFALTEGVPLGTYECPSPYKRLITPEVLKFLLARNRLVYHKDTSIDPEKVKTKLDLIAGSRLEFYDAHTPNALYSLRAGARGMSCIAGNLYPEMFAWMCEHYADADRQHDVTWLQSELTRADQIASGGYSLSAKYFLRKRGVPMVVNSRKRRTPLTPDQCAALDQLFQDVAGWHDRLGIKESVGRR